MELKCAVCETLLTSTVQVASHVKQTGHTDFNEVSGGNNDGKASEIPQQVQQTEAAAEPSSTSESKVSNTPSELREKIKALKSSNEIKEKTDKFNAEKKRIQEGKELALQNERLLNVQREVRRKEIEKEKVEQNLHREKIMIEIETDKLVRKGMDRDAARKAAEQQLRKDPKPHGLSNAQLSSTAQSPKADSKSLRSLEFLEENRGQVISNLKHIIEKILEFPFEKKYKRLRAGSKILQPILQDPKLLHILSVCGFEREDEYYVVHGVIIPKLQLALKHLESSNF